MSRTVSEHRLPTDYQVCSTNSPGLFVSPTTGATNCSGTSKWPYKIPFAVRSIKLPYHNWINTGVETTTGNALTVKSTLVVGTTHYPLYFSGVRTKVIADGATEWCDELKIDIAAGTTVYVLTYWSVTSGQKIPIGVAVGSQNDWRFSCASSFVLLADKTDDTAYTWNTNPGLYGYYYPQAIYGIPLREGHKSIAIVGDSISAAISYQGMGQAQYALKDRFPFVNIAFSGEQASGFVTGHAKRAGLLLGVTDAVVMYGTNGMAYTDTLSDVEGDLHDVAAYLEGLGIRVWGCTIPPRTSSTSGFCLTEAEQTVITDNDAHTKRVDFNNWLRSVPPHFSGCIDVSKEVEGVDTNKWKAAVLVIDSTATNNTSATYLYDSTQTWPLSNAALPGGYIDYCLEMTSGDSVAVKPYTRISLRYAATALTAFGRTGAKATDTYKIYKNYAGSGTPAGSGIHPTLAGYALMARAFRPLSKLVCIDGVL
jgi:hypothetical protein